MDIHPTKRCHDVGFLPDVILEPPNLKFSRGKRCPQTNHKIKPSRRVLQRVLADGFETGLRIVVNASFLEGLNIRGRKHFIKTADREEYPDFGDTGAGAERREPMCRVGIKQCS